MATAKSSPTLNLALLLLISLVCGLIAVLAGNRRPISAADLFHTRRENTRRAFMTLPNRTALRRWAALILLYALVAVPLGLVTGFLRLEPLQGTGRKLLAAATLLVEPGILEELIFRVWLLPHPQEDVSGRRRLVSVVAGLLVFVLAHPISGMTLSPRARDLFTDVAFLLQATLLGAVCSVAYLLSGSIWPPMLLHWIPVTIWILYLGGARRVARSKWWDS